MPNVRIIAGKYGGRIIAAPDTKRTHPMSERIRNALFNSIGDEVQGARVLDAFAGSGAIGFEALSRGASQVVFVEKDRAAQAVVAENIAKLGIEDEASLVRASVAAWRESVQDEMFDIIFCDPPFYKPQFSTVLGLLGLLKPNGLMVLSHQGRGESLPTNGVVVVDNRSYGDAALTFYRHKN